jgi:hypothetical protein
MGCKERLREVGILLLDCKETFSLRIFSTILCTVFVIIIVI